MSFRSASSRGKRISILVAALLLSMPVLAACGATVTAPDVVGMRLDDAHRKFEALDVKNFDDKDHRGERSPFLDHGWVVIKQSPAAGTKNVDTGTKIVLTIAKYTDRDIATLVDTDTPVGHELMRAAAQKREAKARAAEAATKEKQEEAAAKVAAEKKKVSSRRTYSRAIDTLASTFNKAIKLFDQNVGYVRSSGGGVTESANALATHDFFSLLQSNAEALDPPQSADLGHVNDDLADAAGEMAKACSSLVDAIDTQVPSAFARAVVSRAEARDAWAKAIRKIYVAADRTPPLPPR